jgi:prophage regulatory protein
MVQHDTDGHVDAPTTEISPTSAPVAERPRRRAAKLRREAEADLRRTIAAELRSTHRIVSPEEVGRLFGVSKVTLWRMRRDGLMPQPIQLSKGRIGWTVATIEAWLAERGAAAR